MAKHVVQIETDGAPKAIGPYSQGVSLNSSQRLIFVSGQLPLNPSEGKIVEGDIRAQASRVIDNLEAVLKEAGSGLEQVVRVDIFLKDINKDFGAVNEVYAERFVGNPKPVRQTVEVSELPLGVSIEMSCIAYKEDMK